MSSLLTCILEPGDKTGKKKKKVLGEILSLRKWKTALQTYLLLFGQNENSLQEFGHQRGQHRKAEFPAIQIGTLIGGETPPAWGAREE